MALAENLTKTSVAPCLNRKVAIVGGGASGTLVAAQLLRRLEKGDEVVLIHNRPPESLGVAYGTGDLEHLLNVRSQSMTAYPDQPGHFVQWLVDQGVGQAADLNDAFISRRIYGEYLSAALAEARSHSQAELRMIGDEAVELQPVGTAYQLKLASGESLDATHVVLALGHLGPKLPSFLAGIDGHPRFVKTPWTNELRAIPIENEDLLIIGTGLTMVDTLMTLQSRVGANRIYARSRHGLLPQPHRAGPKPPPVQVEGPTDDIRALARQIIGQCRAAGPEWRTIIDGCRGRTAEWWQGLDRRQRARFLRHLQVYWDVHRHRVAEETFAVVKQMQIQEQLDVASATVTCVEPHHHGFTVRAKRTAGREEKLEVGWIVNCAGPQTDYRAAKSLLLESAVQSGLAVYDPMGLGLSVDNRYRTDPDARVWTLGPLCRGCLWETTAMPEIRVQAESIACQCTERSG